MVASYLDWESCGLGEMERVHIAAQDFSHRFWTIIRGYEKDPKGLEYVVYDCEICKKSRAVTCTLFKFLNRPANPNLYDGMMTAYAVLLNLL